MTTLHLIDASIYVFRAYYSMPPNFYDEQGNLVHAVYGYASFLLDIRARGMTHASVAFDESLTTCYRNDIYPEYKANRDLPDENLKFQLMQCQRLTTMLGFHSVCLKEFEADDIIGTLATRLGVGADDDEDVDIVIVTRDKDLGQLLRENDMLWDFANDDYMGPKDVHAKFGVAPDQMADFLALAGDSVDNIPGAPGIGAKTAAQLIQNFGSLQALLDDPAAIETSGIRGAKRIAKIVADNQEVLKLYRRITAIHCAVPIEASLADLVLSAPDKSALSAFCQEMKFSGRMKDRLLG
ncbi:MAG: 5'-3' exonuclease [Candidatus Azotimanducaceae bacterium]|jgi:DNA polymerase-1